jgi:hypothetical protein
VEVALQRSAPLLAPPRSFLAVFHLPPRLLAEMPACLRLCARPVPYSPPPLLCVQC